MSNNRYPQRKSPRLQSYDYTQSGAYFVTICTYKQAHWFGHIADGVMLLNQIGYIAVIAGRQSPIILYNPMNWQV
jgi:hypothetical protein